MNKRQRKRRAAPAKVAVRWLTTPEAAAYANLSRSTLEKLRCLGGGPAYSKPGRIVVYDIALLDRFIEARRCASTSSPSPPMTGAPAPAKAPPLPSAPDASKPKRPRPRGARISDAGRRAAAQL
jgi:hypothetical protein